MKKFLIVFGVSMLMFGCFHKKEEEPEVVVIEPEVYEETEVEEESEDLEIIEEDLLADLEIPDVEVAEEPEKNFYVIATKELLDRKIQVVDSFDDKEIHILYSDDIDTDRVLAKLPYDSDDFDITLTFDNRNFAIIRYEISNIPGEVFVNLWDFVVVQVDYAKFIVSESGNYVVSYGELPYSAGLLVQRIGDRNVNKIVTKNPVEDVTIEDGILQYREMNKQTWDIKTVNLDAYAEFLEK